MANPNPVPDMPWCGRHQYPYEDDCPSCLEDEDSYQQDLAAEAAMDTDSGDPRGYWEYDEYGYPIEAVTYCYATEERENEDEDVKGSQEPIQYCKASSHHQCYPEWSYDILSVLHSGYISWMTTSSYSWPV